MTNSTGPVISGNIGMAERPIGEVHQLASAIFNDIVSGLRGYHHNISMSLEQLEDEVVEERLNIIKEYSLHGIFPIQDLLVSLNCVPVDCKDLERCRCGTVRSGDPVAHFEIPQLLNDFGIVGVDYIGTVDRHTPFVIYTSLYGADYYAQYRKRSKRKPYVFLDLVPNENQMIDGYIFNAPMIDMLTVVAIFKDPRLVEETNCCMSGTGLNFLSAIIKERLTKKKIYYYRLLVAPLLPNDQQYTM